MKIIVIQQSDCKGNFNKTVYISIYLSIHPSNFRSRHFVPDRQRPREALSPLPSRECS